MVHGWMINDYLLIRKSVIEAWREILHGHFITAGISV